MDIVSSADKPGMGLVLSSEINGPRQEKVPIGGIGGALRDFLRRQNLRTRPAGAACFLIFVSADGIKCEGDGGMVYAIAVAAFMAASLAMPVAVDRGLPSDVDGAAPISAEQRNAAIRPLVSRATECIARTVSADPRFEAKPAGAAFNNLIVESVPSCVEALRSMIDGFDRLYGEGAGESFFMGPYLDSLPAAVTKRVNGR
jgi:hypothetical protein